MLTFEEKIRIIDTFPELTRKDVSLGRVNYHYEESAHEKKTVVYHLHPNGNGFVFVGLIDHPDMDERGMVNIRDCGEPELRKLIAGSIKSLAPRSTGEQAIAGDGESEHWVNKQGHTLLLMQEEEDEMWYIYAGLNLESAFDTREEAEEYLIEEGFMRKG